MEKYKISPRYIMIYITAHSALKYEKKYNLGIILIEIFSNGNWKINLRGEEKKFKNVDNSCFEVQS